MFSPVESLPKLVFVIVAWAWARSALKQSRIAGNKTLEIFRYAFIVSPKPNPQIPPITQNEICEICGWISSACGGLAHQCYLSSIAAFSEDLIRHHANQDHGA